VHSSTAIAALQSASTLLERTTKKIIRRYVAATDADGRPRVGQVEINGQVIDVQITATYGGRPVAKEYRPNVTRLTDIDDDELRERVDAIPDALECAIKKKIAKGYRTASMVVYLNIPSHGIRQAETEEAIAEIKARRASAFFAIHVLWAGKLFCRMLGVDETGESFERVFVKIVPRRESGTESSIHDAIGGPQEISCSP
jgi:hypothetical protein